MSDDTTTRLPCGHTESAIRIHYKLTTLLRHGDLVKRLHDIDSDSGLTVEKIILNRLCKHPLQRQRS